MIKPGTLIKVKHSLWPTKGRVFKPGEIVMFLETKIKGKVFLHWFLSLNGHKICIPTRSSMQEILKASDLEKND